jgi:hypothetical protein
MSAILAIVYVVLGYAIAMSRCSGRERRAFAENRPEGGKSQSRLW